MGRRTSDQFVPRGDSCDGLHRGLSVRIRSTGTRTEPEPSERLPDWLIDPHLPIKALNY